MTFFVEFTPIRFFIYAIKLLIPTAINVFMINWISSSAIERNDTSLFEAFLLIISFLGGISFLQDAIRKLWRQLVWQHTLLFVVCAFNVYYFFKMLVCCIPSPGIL
jgi:NhaP-type Na+/H+ or K+/H+ antiporter